MSNVLMDISLHADTQHRTVLSVYMRNYQHLKTYYYLKQSFGEMSGQGCRLLSTIWCEWWNSATGFAIPGSVFNPLSAVICFSVVSHKALPTTDDFSHFFFLIKNTVSIMNARSRFSQSAIPNGHTAYGGTKKTVVRETTNKQNVSRK